MIGGAGGAGARGCEAADYPREASACEGQKLRGSRPPSSAALGEGFMENLPLVSRARLSRARRV